MRRVVLITVVLAGAALVAPPISADTGVTVVAGHGALASADVTVAAFEREGENGGHLRVESAPGFLFVSEVRCIRVVGDRVLVGGVIVRSPTPATLGSASLIALEDGGPGGDDPFGIAFSNSGLDSCPVFELPMHTLVSGNFTVA